MLLPRRLVQNNICSLSPHQHFSDRLLGYPQKTKKRWLSPRGNTYLPDEPEYQVRSCTGGVTKLLSVAFGKVGRVIKAYPVGHLCYT